LAFVNSARAIALLLLSASCGGAGQAPRSMPGPAPAAPAGEPVAAPRPTERATPAPAADAHERGGSVLPSLFSRHHVFLRATVGGTPALLLFDSGASATILSPRLVQRLGLSYRGRQMAFGIGEPVTDAAAFEGVDIRIGPVQIRPATVLSWPDAGFPTYAGSVPDGVIGYDLLQSRVVLVDAVGGRVVAFDTSTPPPPPRRGAQSVTLRVTYRLPVIDAEIFASGESATDRATTATTFPVVIDFGAGAALQLSRVASVRLGFPARLRDARLRQLVGIGGTIELPEGTTDSVRIAGASVPQALVATDTTETPSVALADAEGLIGTELLRRFVVTLDYVRGRAVFEPNALLRAPFCRNAAGVCVRTEAGLRGAAVVFVDPGSSAARAGIRPGNLILAVDGASVAQLSAAEVDRLLDRGPGALLEVVRSAAQLRALPRPDAPQRGPASRRAATRERERVSSEMIRLPVQ
jgi:hypothetical protein